MPLRSLNVVPPGGWKLSQSLPDGTTKNFASMGLAWELASQIADFRKGNGLPRATPREALVDIEEATCTRLHNDPNWCIKKKTATVRPAVAHPSNAVRHAASGVKVLVDWFGSGAKPVPIEIAQRRANVCLECPENQDGHSLLRLTAGAVRAIAEQMNAKEHLKLRVEGEERLHACRICRCPLRLKVHVPLATILAHTDEETLNAFPAYCWLATERQTL